MIDTEIIQRQNRPPITEKYTHSFCYHEDTSSEMVRRGWADAKRQVVAGVCEKMYPNRDYTIRYYTLTRPSSVYGVGVIEGIVIAEITYRP